MTEKQTCVKCQKDFENIHIIAGYDPIQPRVVVMKFCDLCFKRVMDYGREMAAAAFN